MTPWTRRRLIVGCIKASLIPILLESFTLRHDSSQQISHARFKHIPYTLHRHQEHITKSKSESESKTQTHQLPKSIEIAQNTLPPATHSSPIMSSHTSEENVKCGHANQTPNEEHNAVSKSVFSFLLPYSLNPS